MRTSIHSIHSIHSVHPTHPTRTTLAALGVGALLLLGACGGEETATDPGAQSSAPSSAAPSASPPSTSPSASPSKSPSKEASTADPDPQGPSLAITVLGDQVFPNAESIELGTGDELAVTVDANRPGELHVHGKPEQYVEFASGTTEATLVIETPGSVEIEEHDTGTVVALLEVR